MQGPGQQLSGWHGRGFEGLGREMASGQMGRAERGRLQTVQGRTDGRTRCSPVCALALFEKTSWDGQQRSRGESRGVGEQQRPAAVGSEGANSKGAEKHGGIYIFTTIMNDILHYIINIRSH
ncbi:unnamed protein product [Miscanthus lutarioriparius]|uniref:Uncharacterized protein n=1 Tax=Miscanthus lutarioriparius TaxID=422564 RepID=A0A811MUU2_9POAL|nr:unnamed protein product [Miscanthus lutarioriparius]